LGKASLQDLNEVCCHIAATNFFKHSLSFGGMDLNSLNPKPKSRLDRESVQEYLQKTLELYVLPEIQILKPSMLITYKSLVPILRRAIRSLAAAPILFPINDPSWVKQGMSGVAHVSKGRWHLRTQANPLPPSSRELLEAYLPELEGVFQKKQHAASVYLKFYLLELMGRVLE
jgi:hypothetical protein